MDALGSTSCAQHKTLCCSPTSLIPTADWGASGRPSAYMVCTLLHSSHLPLLLLDHFSSDQGWVTGQLQTKPATKPRLSPGNPCCPIFHLACPTPCVAVVLISPGLMSGSAAGRARWLCLRSPTQTLHRLGRLWCWLLQLLSASVETSACQSLMRE